MKATGIVRRIDDIGRVVIPKEIRRTMRIKEGAPLEIYTSNDGEVIFRKYSPINEMTESASQAAEVMYKLGGAPAVIFDRDHVVAVAGVAKREYGERRVTPALEEVMDSRKGYIAQGESTRKLQPIEGIDKHALAVFPGVLCIVHIIKMLIYRRFWTCVNIKHADIAETYYDISKGDYISRIVAEEQKNREALKQTKKKTM